MKTENTAAVNETGAGPGIWRKRSVFVNQIFMAKKDVALGLRGCEFEFGASLFKRVNPFIYFCLKDHQRFTNTCFGGYWCWFWNGYFLRGCDNVFPRF